MKTKLGAAALILGSLLGSCNNPISGAVSVTASDTTPFGNGQTVYVGFPDTDWYHTGVLMYANNGTGWIQQLSSRAAVTDISVDVSGNVAVAAAGTILYRASGGSWVSPTQSGVTRVSLPTGYLIGLGPSQVLSYTSPASGLTTVNTWPVPGSASFQGLAATSTTIYAGTSAGLYSASLGATTGTSYGSGAATASGINDVFSTSTAVYVATNSGFSYFSGGSLVRDVATATIGLGTPQCVWWLSGGTNGTVYLGTSLGVAISSDNGANWSTVNLQRSVTSISAATAGGDTCIYAATSRGLYVYDGNANSWSVAFSGYQVNKVFVTVP